MGGRRGGFTARQGSMFPCSLAPNILHANQQQLCSTGINKDFYFNHLKRLCINVLPLLLILSGKTLTQSSLKQLLLTVDKRITLNVCQCINYSSKKFLCRQTSQKQNNENLFLSHSPSVFSILAFGFVFTQFTNHLVMIFEMPTFQFASNPFKSEAIDSTLRPDLYISLKALNLPEISWLTRPSNTNNLTKHLIRIYATIKGMLGLRKQPWL